MKANGIPVLREGVIFILSAPSGAGKTTLVKKLLNFFPEITLSVSYTTRGPRAGEIDGKDYRFVKPQVFGRMRSKGAFAEWARVHGSLYGTPKRPLDRLVRRGRDVLLDIDVHGSRKIKRLYPGAVAIFLLPPSWRELEKRLALRGTDGSETIRQRLENARSEVREVLRYDYSVVNERIPQAFETLKSIIIAERHRVSRRQNASIKKRGDRKKEPLNVGIRPL